GATARADRRAATSLFVAKPALSISQSGPEVAEVGSEVAILVNIANHGAVLAKDVVITNELPAGLSCLHPELDAKFKVGDLGPGEARSFPIILQASARGKLCSKLNIKSLATKDEANDELCVTFAATDFTLTMTGDSTAAIGQIARYQITLFNSGDTKLTGLVLTDNPGPAKILGAAGAVIQDGKAVWTIGNLNAGDERRFEITLSSDRSGTLPNTIEAVNSQGLKRAAAVSTGWK
ncbi:MAG TPA: hypothetical protein VHH73_13355, partial [Verrucomicrobiae bacterium]|nr:hypothetical protein [Verrucomicrobiae bacterium]